MIWAYIALALGVIVWFVPEPIKPVVMVAALACGALYLRTMARRAREDVR